MTKLSFVRQVTVATLSVLLCSNLWAASSDTLAPRQRAIVAIAAHTANGDLTALERNLVEGLQAGLTVNEIKEVLIQLYAYTGFPRSLNAIHTFMRVMDERTKAGINDPDGKEPSPIPVNLNKDEYGAKVRAKLGGRTEIPPPSGYLRSSPAGSEIQVDYSDACSAELHLLVMIRSHQGIGAEELAYQLPQGSCTCAVQEAYFFVIQHSGFVQESGDPL